MPLSGAELNKAQIFFQIHRGFFKLHVNIQHFSFIIMPVLQGSGKHYLTGNRNRIALWAEHESEQKQHKYSQSHHCMFQ